jgi:hypothetical protein
MQARLQPTILDESDLIANSVPARGMAWEDFLREVGALERQDFVGQLLAVHVDPHRSFLACGKPVEKKS